MSTSSPSTSPASKPRNLGDVLQEFRQHRQLMQRELQKVIVGQDAVIEQIFAGLIDYDLEGKIRPDLAERWEVADD